MIQRKISLASLNKTIQSCKKCEISKLVFNIKDISKGYGKLYGWKGGNKKCKFFFIGTNPSYRRFEGLEYAFGGKDFDEGTGVEFVGYLKKLGILEESFITNICKCSTKDNKLNEIQIDNCLPFLIKEIKVLKPEKILTMGKDSYNSLVINLPRDSEIRKKIHSIWHPNYVMSYNRHLIPEYLKRIGEICH